MALFNTNPNDVLAVDADLDLAWPEPVCEVAESIGRGIMWRFKFDDGFTVSAVPEKGARTFRLFSAQMQNVPFTYANRSAISTLIPDDTVASMSSERCGWLDLYKRKNVDEWQIVVRVQSGAAQSFLYPKRVLIPAEISVSSQVRTGPAKFTSREDAIRSGAGVYYAAARRMAGEVWADNHEPIIEVRREN